MTLEQKYKAASLYESFVQEYGAEEINQKDFAMYLRLQVERNNGILKRSSHGVYELRTDPSDKGISFSRDSKEMDIPPFEEDELIAGICKEEGKADLNELFNDILIMASRLQNTAKLMENQAATSTDLGELQQLRKCISKELDELITSTSALIAWDTDHQVIISSRKELKNMSIQEINRIKKHYPVGTRIELISMDDAYGAGNVIPTGLMGTIKVNRYVCGTCGFCEEWIDQKELPTLKRKFPRA